MFVFKLSSFTVDPKPRGSSTTTMWKSLKMTPKCGGGGGKSLEMTRRCGGGGGESLKMTPKCGGGGGGTANVKVMGK